MELVSSALAAVIGLPVRYLKRGRTGYWDSDKGAVVIEDPGTTGGTVFTPKNGKQYFDNELK